MVDYTSLKTIAVQAGLLGNDTLACVNRLAGSINPAVYVEDSFSGLTLNGYYVAWCQFSITMWDIIARKDPNEWMRAHESGCLCYNVSPLPYTVIKRLCINMLFGVEADLAISGGP